MKDYTPYRYWNRYQLFNHCEKICIDNNALDLIDELKEIIFSDKWNPMENYNGCNVVQDRFHPYPPCLIHDYRWLVGEGGKMSDIEFRNNLRKFGASKVRSNLMYIGVRLGWIFYYKWLNR